MAKEKKKVKRSFLRQKIHSRSGKDPDKVETEYDFPVLFDFPAGHEKTNYPIILGRKVIIDVSKSESKVTFYD